MRFPCENRFETVYMASKEFYIATAREESWRLTQLIKITARINLHGIIKNPRTSQQIS